MRSTIPSTLGVAVLGAGLALLPGAARAAEPAGHHPGPPAGAVYVETNQVAGNAVLAYARAADGTLSAPTAYPTGGTGTGTGLGSQNALVLDHGAHRLYAVNAGSDSVTTFRVGADGLHRLGTVPSGGDQPISVTVRGDRAYVLNAGGAGNVSGFAVRPGGLAPLAGSTAALSGPATGPAQVSFTPDGRQLVVTAKATSTIDLIGLDRRGLPATLSTVASSGGTPFGFGFDRRGRLVVSEAAASTVSTYEVRPGALRTLAASVPTTENAACWIVTTEDGRYVYTGNGGGSNSITGFREGRDGSLTLLRPDGKSASTAGGTSDIAADRHSRHLYARLGDGTVAGFTIGADGSLTALPVAGGVPAGAAGIAAD